MKYLDLTLPTPEENLAADEALLDWCEEEGQEEVLRFWEPTSTFVVVGYANQIHSEVNAAACHEKSVPILRRCSGGGTVLQGPGCLNYSAVLRIENAPALASIPGTNRWVMEKHRDVFQSLVGKDVAVRGHTDLAVCLVKFSGNSQRRRRHYLLFHGTFLLEFDLRLVEELLPLPSKQPAYRGNRKHVEFLTNVGIPSIVVKDQLKQAWNATEALPHWPTERMVQLVDSKYRRPEWNLKF